MATGQYIYHGSKVALDIEVVVSALTTEAQYLVDVLEIEYKKRIATGQAAAAVKAAITQDIKTGSGVMQAWVNKQNRIVNELTKAMVAAPVNNAVGAQKCDWILGAVKTQHCPDCSRMAQISIDEGPKTRADWENYGVGLPREGKTQCSFGCRCMLLPANQSSTAPAPAATKVAATPKTAAGAPKPTKAELRKMALAEAEKRVLTMANGMEKAVVIDRNSKIILDKDGTKKHEVGFTTKEMTMMKDSTLVHNHPSGRAFSLEDLQSTMEGDLSEIVAVGQRSGYNYYFKRPKSGWTNVIGKRLALSQINNDVYNEFSSKIMAGILTPQEADFRHPEEVMLRFVAQFSDLQGCYTKIKRP
jgi:hypothetical protein